MCRHPISFASLLELPPDVPEWTEPKELPRVRSAKIDQIVAYLKIFDTTTKTLVFSQFTSFLDLVATALRDEGINFCRFDGSMNARKVLVPPRIKD